MKLLKVFLCAFAIAFSVWAVAETYVDPDNPDEKPTELQLQGCGYSRPIRVAGMIGNPPFGWVIRHDERGSGDLESFGLGRLILDKIAQKFNLSYVSTGYLSYDKAIRALKNGGISKRGRDSVTSSARISRKNTVSANSGS